MPKKKHKFFRPCEICVSPYRTEIEALIRRKTANTVIAEKYLKRFPGCTKRASLAAKVARHIKHQDEARNFNAIQIPDDSPHAVMPRASMEQFAQKMLDIGHQALKYYEHNPEELDLKDVIAAQRLLIEKQKLTVHEDALKLAMAGFFGGFPIQEGEVVNDKSLPKGPKSIIQPRNKK